MNYYVVYSEGGGWKFVQCESLDHARVIVDKAKPGAVVHVIEGRELPLQTRRVTVTKVKLA